MSQKAFNSTAGTIFLVIGVLHLLRIVNSWPASIGTFSMPMWASWITVLVAGSLAYHGLKRRG